MFGVIFAFMLVTTYAAEIPSYINVCGRQNPNLNQCVIDNIKNLKNKICEGLTDLNIPPLEPLNIDKLVISETTNNKIYLNNVQITGLCDFIINSVSVDLDKIVFKFDISFNQIYLNGTYDIDVHILVPIAHKSPIYITTENANAKVIIQGAKATKKGIEHIYASELKTNIDIKGYDAQYGLKESELSQLGQILGGFIGSNQEEFLQRLIPSLEEEISKKLILIINDVFKMFSYEQLLPHRT